MRVPIFQVDAFTSRLFTGNPAAVMVFDAYPDDAVLQALAAENNLAETAFLVRSGDDYRLRWFTPTVEVPLCGHATLASAAVVMERLEPGRQSVTFRSASGPLTTRRDGARYLLDFPARPSDPIDAPAGMADALGTNSVAVLANAFDWLVVLPDARAVRTLEPDIAGLAALGRSGVIVTAAGDANHGADLDAHHDADYDFVSRYFAPNVGIAEDPVTGGAHCTLVPYWAARTGRSAFHAYQASARGGEVDGRLVGDRVELAGACVFYLEGSAEA